MCLHENPKEFVFSFSGQVNWHS